MKHQSEKDLLITFGRRVKALRKEQKLSQSDLAGKAELEKTAIQRIERGHNSTLDTIRKVANGFDMTLSDLFDFSKMES